MKVQQGDWRDGDEFGSFVMVCLFPSLIRGEPSGPAAGVLIVPVDLGLEELVGRWVIGDFFKGEQSDQSLLEDEEAAFDFSFGGGIGGDTMVDAHGGKGSLELGVSIQPVGWRTVAE